jgi:hypothetical protein
LPKEAVAGLEAKDRFLGKRLDNSLSLKGVREVIAMNVKTIKAVIKSR